MQQSSSVPLELQKKSLQTALERLGMIWLDFIFHYYDQNRLMLFREKGELLGGTVSTEEMENILFSCTSQAGPSSHWSEIAQVTTLDHLLTSGAIRFSEYLERVPDGYIPEKEELLEKARRREEENGFPAEKMPENK